MANLSERPTYYLTQRKLSRGKSTIRNSLGWSLLFHVILMLLGVYGLPLLWKKPLPIEQVVSVDMVVVKKNTNLRSKRASSAAKQSQLKPKAAKAVPPSSKPQPRPEALTTQDTPVLSDAALPEPVASPQPSAEKSPVEQPPAKPKPPKAKPTKRPVAEKPEEPKKEDSDEFDALLKTLEAVADTKSKKKEINDAKQHDEPEDDTPKANTDKPFDADQELSVSVQDAIRSQLARCWTINSGGQDVGGMNVILRITLENDGTVIGVKKIGGRSNGNGALYRVFVENAFRAVQKCSPLQSLPKELYHSWREIDFIFDPREMIY